MNTIVFTCSIFVLIALCLIAEHAEGDRERSNVVVDDHGQMTDGLKPTIQKPQKLFDDVNDGNSDLPFGSEVLTDLFGFKYECDLGFRPGSILIIHSHPKFLERRNVIRNTWGSPGQCQRHRVVLRFVMGRPESIQQENLLVKEMEQYKDMMIGNFTSGVRSTVLQTFLTLRWVRQFCPPAPYLVQAFDNAFIRLDKLRMITNSLRKENNTNSIVGYRHNSSLVIRDRKNIFYTDAETFDRDYFPPFCSLDAGFIMPLRTALKDFSELHPKTKPIPFIDKYYGLAAERHNWTVQHHDAFSLIILKDANDACVMSSKFTAISPSNETKAYDIWKMMTNPNFYKICKKP